MSADTDLCRLCQSLTFRRFERLILEKYPTAYLECSSCGSLQTAIPYWLEEAYAIPGVHIDVGQAARVVQTWLRLCFLLESIDFDRSQKCVDFGGATGLLTRLMRDSSYDFSAYDPYDDSKYANYFRVESPKDFKPSLISAFEVIEHLAQPRATLTELLECGVDLFVFSTQFYEGQGPDWTYLVPFCGQHVFFYTERALVQFAASFGYQLHKLLGFYVLVRCKSQYSARITGAVRNEMNASFVGEHVLKIGWGTEATTKDSQYACDRFIHELKPDRR